MDFRVTRKDIWEFNEYIKSRLPEGMTPRLRKYFNTDNKYEEFMTKYQEENQDKIFSMGSKLGKVVVVTSNPNQLANLLNAIKDFGNGGHTFDVVVDPDSTDKQTFQWDGDGSDRIETIEVIEAEEFEYSKHFSDEDDEMDVVIYLDPKEGKELPQTLHVSDGYWDMEMQRMKDDSWDTYFYIYTIDAGEKMPDKRAIIEDLERRGYKNVSVSIQRPFSKNFSADKIHECDGKWCIDGVDQKFDSEEDAKLFLAGEMVKTFGNPVSEGLSESLDNKLQDFAQGTHGVIGYKDIMDYGRKRQNAKDNRRLHRLINAWYEVWDDKDSEECKDLEAKIAAIVKGDSDKKFSKFSPRVQKYLSK